VKGPPPPPLLRLGRVYAPLFSDLIVGVDFDVYPSCPKGFNHGTPFSSLPLCEQEKKFVVFDKVVSPFPLFWLNKGEDHAIFLPLFFRGVKGGLSICRF